MSGKAGAPRFEGSYLGVDEKISDAAIMECKICWTVYDPAKGDETRAILPGTPFRALPDDWKCPNCDAPKEQFMVRSDPGAAVAAVSLAPGSAAEAQTASVHAAAPGAVDADARRREEERLAAHLREKEAALREAFREVYMARMRDLPFCNRSLAVQTVGFRYWQGYVLGVLITPWTMLLVLMPGPQDDWSHFQTGEKSVETFPSGHYEFIHAVREEVGPYKSCSLFSPMNEFASQQQAEEVARAVMVELFNPENRAEDTDRQAEIRARARREEEARQQQDTQMPSGRERAADDDGMDEGAAKEQADEPAQPTRRAFITGGLAGG